MLSWFAFATADHPIGVTSAFEETAAVVEREAAPAIARANPYYEAKAAEGESPRIGWESMLVLGVLAGSFVSSRLSGDRVATTVPEPWRRRFGDRPATRLAVAFAGGAVMLVGARLAGGCTSGHGISGTLQLAASSWVFSAVFAAAATATALLLYGRGEADHV